MVTLAILKQKTKQSNHALTNLTKNYRLDVPFGHFRLQLTQILCAIRLTTTMMIYLENGCKNLKKWIYIKQKIKNIKHHWFWIIWNYVDLKSGDHTTVDCVNITIIWSNGWAKNACDWKSNQTNQCEQSLFVHGIQKNLKSGIVINICDSQNYWMM